MLGVNLGDWLFLEPWINAALFHAHPPPRGSPPGGDEGYSDAQTLRSGRADRACGRA